MDREPMIDDREKAQPPLPMPTQRQMIDATKMAVKELIVEQVTAGGFWVLKAGAIAVIGAIFVFVLYINGWKHP